MDKGFFLPNNKNDFDAVERLRNLHYDELKSIFPELLVWLQDLHWPISTELAEILRPFADKHSVELVRILQGDDGEWKFNILVLFGRTTNDPLLLNEIRRIALYPTKDEISEEVDLEAKNILKKQADS